MGRAQTAEITVDTTEIAEARWFPRQEARLMLERRHPEGLTVPGKHAIANTLITSFVEETQDFTRAASLRARVLRWRRGRLTWGLTYRKIVYKPRSS